MNNNPKHLSWIELLSVLFFGSIITVMKKCLWLKVSYWNKDFLWKKSLEPDGFIPELIQTFTEKLSILLNLYKI